MLIVLETWNIKKLLLLSFDKIYNIIFKIRILSNIGQYIDFVTYKFF